MLAHTFIHGGMKKSLLSHLAKEHFLRHPVFETKSIFNFNKKCKNRAWQKIDKIDWVRHSLFDSLNSVFTINCQALSISQSLNLSLSLRDRDRADTIITFHHHHPPTENFLST